MTVPHYKMGKGGVGGVQQEQFRFTHNTGFSIRQASKGSVESIDTGAGQKWMYASGTGVKGTCPGWGTYISESST